MNKLLLVGQRLVADEALQRLLTREGFELIKVDDGDQALQELQHGEVVCALIDNQAEGGGGVELLKQLRQATPGCEVILVTDGGETDTAIEVLRAGALDYLRRPVDEGELRVALGRARERRPQRQVPQRPVLLVLEDHEPTLRRMVRVLQKEGYEVLSASDGKTGLKLFDEQRVDLILADMRMPEMTGLDVLRETKAKGADVEFILVTGYGDEDAVVQALRGGAINFLKKPVDIEQMLLSIEKALEFQRARRSLAYRNRDLQLMQLVVRLTGDLELIVETPHGMSNAARQYLAQLVDSLPLGIAVVGADRSVIFANQQVIRGVGQVPSQLEQGWVTTLGNVPVDSDDLDQTFARALQAGPGSIETLRLSNWAFVVMTPVRLLRPDGTEKYVAVAIRGERRNMGTGIK